MFAVIKGHAECARLLLEAGANANHVDAEGCTALVRTIIAGHAECAHLLLDGGADVNYAGVDGRTALMVASSLGHTECERLLLEAGAAHRVVRVLRPGAPFIICFSDRLFISKISNNGVCGLRVDTALHSGVDPEYHRRK
ncbi:ankyrin repeat-containing domain protein [Pavlovales sp. CCMP2436]|nr:ankyrin repeat-containing domain protein [Pavlovales sp. CCMP2436]